MSYGKETEARDMLKEYVNDYLFQLNGLPEEFREMAATGLNGLLSNMDEYVKARKAKRGS